MRRVFTGRTPPGVLETLFSQIVGERFMMAKQNEKGKYAKDIAATRKNTNYRVLKNHSWYS